MAGEVFVAGVAATLGFGTTELAAVAAPPFAGVASTLGLSVVTGALKLIQNDFTTEQIAASLNLSVYTVETHRKNIKHKLNFETKQEYYTFLKNL